MMSAMTPLEARIWLLIVQHHHGRDKVIGVPALAEQGGVSERQTQKIVKRLIEVYGCPIASTPHPPAGYFIPETFDEIADTLDSLKGRALSILTRMSRLRRSTLRETVGQLLLGIEEDAA